MAFTHPIRLHYKLASKRFLRTKILSQNDFSLALMFEKIVKEIQQTESELSRQTQLQLGLETIYQLIGTSILLLYAYSQTKTRQGLTAFFEQTDFEIIGIVFSGTFIITVLLTLNLVTFIKSHFNGSIHGYASNCQAMGKLLLLLSILINCLIRVWSTILYFSPVLGLFNLLHHYQGMFYNHYLVVDFKAETNLAIMCRIDELSSTMS